MTPTIQEILRPLEQFAPLSLQEDYDNCGLLIGSPDTPCTGALLTVDVTPATVAEAIATRCNLIIAHHPLIFRGLKRLTGQTLVEQTVIDALRAGVAIYACHTCLDNAPEGVSFCMARMLGLTDIRVLDPRPADPSTGSGAIGRFPEPVTATELVAKVKQAFGSPMVRCTEPPAGEISSVALCGGSGSFLIPAAEASGAQAFITSDTKYHDFVDHSARIFLIDIGHHESENCTKQIFYHVITKFFPNFAVRYAQTDINPIKYL